MILTHKFVLVDDAGVDVNVFGIHVDLRDEDDVEAKEKKEKEESKEKKSESKKDGKDEKKDKKKGDAKKG